MAQDYEINVKVKGVDQAKSSVDNLTDSMNEAGEASGAAFSKLDSMLGGVPSKIKGAVGGVKNLAGGFKSLRAAIISTGIGALVVALASLATFFTKTQRGLPLPPSSLKRSAARRCSKRHRPDSVLPLLSSRTR